MEFSLAVSRGLVCCLTCSLPLFLARDDEDMKSRALFRNCRHYEICNAGVRKCRAMTAPPGLHQTCWWPLSHKVKFYDWPSDIPAEQTGN
jgi:hypothetical protein